MVRRMAHVTTPLAKISIVDAKTIHPPHATCGTNSRISTRNASRVIKSVGTDKMVRARRKRGECEGECRWDTAAIMKQINVRRAAIGWTTRIEERSVRALEGSVKSELSLELPKMVFASGRRYKLECHLGFCLIFLSMIEKCGELCNL